MISRTIIGSALVAATSFAAADVVVSYSFTDLNGSFDGQFFSANADKTGSLETGGDVSLLTGSGGTAQYDTGFFGLGSADVSINLEVSNITASSADSFGSVSITDADGDTLTATVSGTWDILSPFGFMFFSGTSSDFVFADNGAADGTFDGTTGSFDLAALSSQIFDGAVSVILQNFGGFSAGDFSDVSTQSDGILIPTPGMVVIAGAGLIGMTGTRRRN